MKTKDTAKQRIRKELAAELRACRRQLRRAKNCLQFAVMEWARSHIEALKKVAKIIGR